MNKNGLVYGVKDKPGLWKTIVFALQQVLAILAATIVVPVIIKQTFINMAHKNAEVWCGSHICVINASPLSILYAIAN